MGERHQKMVGENYLYRVLASFIKSSKNKFRVHWHFDIFLIVSHDIKYVVEHLTCGIKLLVSTTSLLTATSIKTICIN